MLATLLRDATAVVAAWVATIVVLGRLCMPQTFREPIGHATPPDERKPVRSDFVLAA